MKRTKIKIDYAKCGADGRVDPRTCRKCLNVCDTAVFLMHPTLENHPDPYNPERWMITPVWPSICTGCMRCAKVCPEGAISVVPGQSLYYLKNPPA